VTTKTDEGARPAPDDPDREPGYQTSPSLLYAVKQVELAVRAHLDEILRSSSVTALQYTALTVLRRRDGLTSAQLARNSFVRTQSMADMVASLERQGLIRRRRDPHDARRSLISLTDEGREVLRRYEVEVEALEQRMLSGLTQPQIRNMRETLNRCRAALTDTPAH
jgi:DNA-binding MarR family transcriptional regulator